MERIAFILYLVVLLWSPLAFGAVRLQTHSMMSLGVFAASLLLVIKNIGKGRKTGAWQFRYPATGLNPLFLLILFYLLFQIVPLPESVLRLLSPEAWIAAVKSSPASQAVTAQGTHIGWSSLAPYTNPTRVSLILWVTYGFFFFGFSSVLDTRKRIEAAVFALLLLGGFEALYGLIQTYSGYEHIWWYKKRAHLGDVTGTYVNRNHLAGLMEMLIMLAAVYAGAITSRGTKKKAPLYPKHYLRARLSEWLSGEQRFNKRAFVLFAGMVMGIGLIFSASRGGMLATAGGLLSMSLFFLLRRSHRRKGLAVFVLFGGISVYALAIGVEHPASRFQSFDADFSQRARYAKRAYMAFQDFPLTGAGIGSLRYVYPKYQDPADRKVGITYAHNDWVQFLAEAGLVGFGLFLAGIIYFLHRLMKTWRQRHDPFAVCIGVAPFAAFAAIGIHSWSDFNLHIPANFLMLTAVAAIGYSALRLESRHHAEKPLSAYRVAPLNRWGGAILVFILAVTAWCGFWAFRHSMADSDYTTARLTDSNRDFPTAVEALQGAAQWDPAGAEYLYDLALSLRKAGSTLIAHEESDEQKRISLQLRIIHILEKAVRLNPFHEEAHIRLGWEYTRFWNAPEAPDKWIPAADLSMERAAYFAGENNPFLHVLMGDYWLMRSKTVSPANTQWETMLQKARWHYQKNLSLEIGEDRKRMMEHIRKNVWVHYPDEEFVKRMLQE